MQADDFVAFFAKAKQAGDVVRWAGDWMALADIPAGYYAGIEPRTAKPIVFTEIGWHSDPNPAGWESSEVEQGEFVRAFFSQSATLDKKLALWSFLYDLNVGEPLRSMGLWRQNDDPKAAWQTWRVSLSSRA